jgi:hypothetical protein
VNDEDDEVLITMTTAFAFSVCLIKATTHFTHKISIKHLQGMSELHYYYYYYYTINRRLEKATTTFASNSKSKVLIPFLLAFCLNFSYFKL